MRTFIAVRITATPAIQAVLHELARMRPEIRLVTEDQLHVTVKFLGDTEKSQVPNLLETARQVAHQEKSATLTLQGLGAFPRLERPTVIWSGFEDSQLLVRLAKQLDDRCLQFGFESESRLFQPHLTLGRVKSEPPRDLSEYLSERKSADFGSVEVTSLELYRSDLGPGGPVYASLGSAPLMG